VNDGLIGNQDELAGLIGVKEYRIIGFQIEMPD
jgi:hypothetical protein